MAVRAQNVSDPSLVRGGGCRGPQAAAFGKCFAENYQADKFVDMCRTIRVLNAVRHHEVGIALTETQCVAGTDRAARRCRASASHSVACAQRPPPPGSKALGGHAHQTEAAHHQSAH